MKSLEELRAIKEKMKASVNDRNENSDKIKVVIGMATCGIAAGARPVMQAFLDEIAKRGLDNVTVSGTINATHNGTKFLAGLIGKYYNNNNNSRINGDNTCSYGALSIYENNNQMTDVFPYNN